MTKHPQYPAMKCAIMMLAIVGITMGAHAQVYESRDVNYAYGTGPDLEAHQANQRGYEWTVRNGTAAVDLTGKAPFMYWFQDPLASGIVTAQITIVSATAGVFRALFEPTDLNPAFMTNAASGSTNLRYGVGVTFSGGPSVARQGRFRLLSDPYSAGAVAQTFTTTNINWALINWIGLPAWVPMPTNTWTAGYVLASSDGGTTTYAKADATGAGSGQLTNAFVFAGVTNLTPCGFVWATGTSDTHSVTGCVSYVTTMRGITNLTDTLSTVLARGRDAGTAGITNIQFAGYYLALDQYIDFENSIIGGTTPWTFLVKPTIPGYVTNGGATINGQPVSNGAAIVVSGGSALTELAAYVHPYSASVTLLGGTNYYPQRIAEVTGNLSITPPVKLDTNDAASIWLTVPSVAGYAVSFPTSSPRVVGYVPSLATNASSELLFRSAPGESNWWIRRLR